MNHPKRLPLSVVVATSLAWSILLMLLFAPGLSITDSLVRAMTASYFAFATDVAPWAKDSWFPPGMALAMSASLRWTGSLTPHTFLTCWWFFAAAGALIAHLLPRAWAIPAFIFILLFPPFWNHAVTILPDVPVSAAITTLVLWILKRRGSIPASRSDKSSRSAMRRALMIAGFTVSCVVLFSYRANSLTLIPIIVAGAIWSCQSFKRALPYAAIVTASVTFSLALPRILNLEPRNTLAASYIWEHVGMLRFNHDPQVAQTYSVSPWSKDTSLDPIAANKLATKAHTWYSHDSLIWDPTPLNAHAITQPGNTIARQHHSLALSHPKLFYSMKWEIAKSLLGLRERVPLAFIFEWDPPEAKEFHVRVSHTSPFTQLGRTLNKHIQQHGVKFMNAIERPWPIILLSLILASIAIARKRVSIDRTWIILAAAAYYAGFFLITPGFHYRYFLPTHILLFIFIASALHDLTHDGLHPFKRRHTRPE